MNYGYRVTNMTHGDLIIGTDATLGGIICDDNLVLPIPGDIIDRIPIPQISKYFPKGYTILRNNKTFDDLPYQGNIFGTILNYTLCNPCTVDLIHYKDSNVFTPQSLFWLKQEPNHEGRFINFYGYTLEYYPLLKRGIMQGVFYHSSSDDEYYPLEVGNDNSIYFQLDSYNDLIYTGNILLDFHALYHYYNFTGVMHQV